MASKFKIWLALIFAGALLAFPKDALDAANSAISVWATAYAPAMLPFFIILPVLASGEAAAMYEARFQRVMRLLFNCPGRSAGAVLIGLMAGSPAGAVALRQLAGGQMDRGQLSRAALISGGLSPLFLLSGVGVSMLGSVECGWILVRAQLGAVFLGGLMFRSAWLNDRTPLAVQPANPAQLGISGAAVTVIGVCANMVLFSVIARVCGVISGGRFETPLIAVIEAASGSARLAAMPLPIGLRLTLIAFSCGLSGASIIAQNAAQLIALGLPPLRLIAGKCAQSVLMALMCGAQLRLMPRVYLQAGSGQPLMLERAAVLATLALILAAVAICSFTKRGSHSER